MCWKPLVLRIETVFVRKRWEGKERKGMMLQIENAKYMRKGVGI